MPELPEVHALAADLDGRLRGHVVARLDLLSFAALKTFDPPVSAIEEQTIRGVTRHGKFLDFAIGDLHMVMHLARAGWVRWNDGTRPTPPRTGKSPLAAQLLLDDGAGLNITEAGTKKSLAIYLVAKPTDVPGIARLGPTRWAKASPSRSSRTSSPPPGGRRSKESCATSRRSPASATPIRTRSCTSPRCTRPSPPR